MKPDLSINLQKWNQIDRYSKWIWHSFRKYIKNCHKILDIGSGTGTMPALYISQENSVVATDIFEHQINYMKERFKNQKNFRAILWDVEKDDSTNFVNEKFDAIVCTNVLEHLEDDVQAVNKMKEIISKKGRVVIFVPACPSLYCWMDRNVGHYRRYTKKSLMALAAKTDMRVLSCKYFNILGIIPYWIRGRKPKPTGSFSTQMTESSSKLINFATSIMEPLERIISPPIGLSVIIILEK